MVHAILGVRAPVKKPHGADCHGRMDQPKEDLTSWKLLLG
jgi:hypothetical protein